MITAEQAKDLRQFKASELIIGGIFYKKEGKEFRRCVIEQGDLKYPIRAQMLREETVKLSKEGLLFVRIGKPWKGFE